MSATLGLAIWSDRVSAVLIRRGVAKWSDVRPFDGAASRSLVITQLVAACPRPRWSRSRVAVAIGPSGVQVKRLTDVPPGINPKALGGIVRESAGRFFLKNGIPLETTCAPARGDGTVWAAAYDASLIRDVERACHQARWRLDALVPLATVLRLAICDESVAWADGDLLFQATYRDATLFQFRCERMIGVDRPALPTPAPNVGDAGLKNADLLPAFAATLVRRGEPLALQRSQPLGRAPSRRQLHLAAASGVLAFMCWWLAPGISATVRANNAQRELSSLASRARVDRTDLVTLDSVTSSLRAGTAFEARARSMTLMLAEVTRALPDSCTIVQLQVVDSTGGNVVAMAPRAAQIVDALERVPLIAAPTIAGPVASQSLGGRSVERVSVAFRFIP